MHTESGLSQSQYLTFSVAEEEYGVPVLSVREILEYGVITRVPRAPKHIRGVMNLRGRVVPLIDLAIRYGLPPSTPTKHTCVVVVEADVRGERTIMGLIVDAVTQVLELPEENIEPPPPFGLAADQAFLSGMGRIDSRFVLLLDVERVLTVKDETDLLTDAAEEPSANDLRSRIEETQAPPRALTNAAAALAVVLLSIGSGRAAAQEPIKDNSFLIEEAYNQERGVVQHISTFSKPRGSGDWSYTFTQEWPLPDERHQVSFTLPVQSLSGVAPQATGVGDVSINYRYQALGVKGGAVAFSPRISFTAPTGRSSRGLGAGGSGLQVNLPVSWRAGRRLVTHLNAGAIRTFSARDIAGATSDTTSIFLGQSFVWLSSARFNVLVETLWSRTATVVGPRRTMSENALVVSPGIRWSRDFKNGLQVVPGIAFPIGLGPSRGERSVFLYLSLEHSFRSRP